MTRCASSCSWPSWILLLFPCIGRTRVVLAEGDAALTNTGLQPGLATMFCPGLYADCVKHDVPRPQQVPDRLENLGRWLAPCKAFRGKEHSGLQKTFDAASGVAARTSAWSSQDVFWTCSVERPRQTFTSACLEKDLSCGTGQRLQTPSASLSECFCASEVWQA